MNPFATVKRHLVNGLFVGCMVFLSCGCQTFNMSEEEFARQQRGGTVDDTTGEAVAIGGTAAYFAGAVAAAAVNFGK